LLVLGIVSLLVAVLFAVSVTMDARVAICVPLELPTFADPTVDHKFPCVSDDTLALRVPETPNPVAIIRSASPAVTVLVREQVPGLV